MNKYSDRWKKSSDYQPTVLKTTIGILKSEGSESGGGKVTGINTKQSQPINKDYLKSGSIGTTANKYGTTYQNSALTSQFKRNPQYPEKKSQDVSKYSPEKSK
jgi:hypothetical protein